MARYDEENDDDVDDNSEYSDNYDGYEDNEGIDKEGVDEQEDKDENKEDEENQDNEEEVYEEIIPNKKTIIKGRGLTSKKMNKYETARLVGVVASFIEFPEFVTPKEIVKESNSYDEVKIAKKWIDTTSSKRKLPVVILRELDNHKIQEINPEDLISTENSYFYSGIYPM